MPGGSGGGIPGNGGCTGLAFWRFFSGRGLATRAGLLQRLPRGPLRRVPRRPLPAGAGRARGRVLHPARVEGRSPASVIILSQLKVEALAMHPAATCPIPGHVSSQVRSAWSARSYEGIEHPAKPSAARRSWPRWSSTRYSITWSARSSNVCGIVSPRALAVLRLKANVKRVGRSTGISVGGVPLRILTASVPAWAYIVITSGP